MKVAYVRVSTMEQNEARQVAALEPYGIEKWFTDKKSGRSAEREQLGRMLEFVREGDVVCVHDLGRLARSTKDLLGIMETLEEKKVSLVSNKEQIDTTSPVGKMLTTVLASVYEFQVNCQREAQLEGIREAKRRGVYKGGRRKKIDRKAYDDSLERYMRREISKAQFARCIGVSRPTLDRYLANPEGILFG